jgi:hypothetical protein
MLAKWSVVFRPKDQGGLGIQDLEVKNTALLGKWLFRLLTEDGVWQTLLRQKYVGLKALSQVLWKPGDSHFWAGMMATKKHFSAMENFRLKMGLRYIFGRISGLVQLHSENSIQHCMLLCIIRVIQFPMFWRLTPKYDIQEEFIRSQTSFLGGLASTLGSYPINRRER